MLGTGSGRTYSVVGDTVNLGSRIEGLAPAGGVATVPRRHVGSGVRRTSRRNASPSGVAPSPSTSCSSSACRPDEHADDDPGPATPRARSGRSERPDDLRALAAGLPDPDAEDLRRPDRRAAFLALDRKRGRERRLALRAAVTRSRRRNEDTRPEGHPRLRGNNAIPSRRPDRSRCSRRASSAAPPESSSASASPSTVTVIATGSESVRGCSRRPDSRPTGRWLTGGVAARVKTCRRVTSVPGSSSCLSALRSSW